MSERRRGDKRLEFEAYPSMDKVESILEQEPLANIEKAIFGVIWTRYRVPSPAQLGTWMRFCRVALGITQNTLAEVTGLHIQTIKAIELGQKKDVKLSTAEVLIRVLSRARNAAETNLKAGKKTKLLPRGRNTRRDGDSR